MSSGIRRTGTIAGVGAAAVASMLISMPSASADEPMPVPVPPPAPGDPVVQAAPPAPVPHLSSPENLPPGTSDTPDPARRSPAGAYAHSIWEAIQNHDITWREGLILLAQRPMNADATPPPGLSAGPQQPGPADAPAPPPPPGLLPTP